MQRLASIYFNVPALRPGTVGAYVFAFLCAEAAATLRLAMILISWAFSSLRSFLRSYHDPISGSGAGLRTAPRLSFYIDHPGEIVGVLVFVLVTLSNVILVAGLRFAVERYKERLEKERLLMGEVNHRARTASGRSRPIRTC
jgi:hypothetical protein